MWPQSPKQLDSLPFTTGNLVNISPPPNPSHPPHPQRWNWAPRNGTYSVLEGVNIPNNFPLFYIHLHFSVLSPNSFLNYLWGKNQNNMFLSDIHFRYDLAPFFFNRYEIPWVSTFRNSKWVSIARNPRPLIPLGCKWILYSNSVFHYHREMFKWTDKKHPSHLLDQVKAKEIKA